MTAFPAVLVNGNIEGLPTLASCVGTNLGPSLPLVNRTTLIRTHNSQEIWIATSLPVSEGEQFDNVERISRLSSYPAPDLSGAG